MLTDQQIETYRRDGYLVIPRLIQGEQLAELRALTDRIVAEARGVSANDELYDLEPSHSAALPRVRRLKPAIFKRYAFFHALARDPKITSILAQLLGPAIRQHGGKLNMKSAGYGSPVEWHQDWAFYPHTNDDVLATGIYLDDCDMDNGPLMVIPGSHHGPTYDHHADGRFCGAMNPDACDIDFAKAVPLMGPAGLDDHPSRAPGARLGAQPLQPPAPPAAARIHRRRCLAADGRGQLRGVQRPHGAGRAHHRAARRGRARAHAAAAGRPSGLDLREPARHRPALLRDLRRRRANARH